MLFDEMQTCLGSNVVDKFLAQAVFAVLYFLKKMHCKNIGDSSSIITSPAVTIKALLSHVPWTTGTAVPKFVSAVTQIIVAIMSYYPQYFPP